MKAYRQKDAPLTGDEEIIFEELINGAVKAINNTAVKDGIKKIKDTLKDLGYKTKNIKFPEIGDLLKAENIGNNFE